MNFVYGQGQGYNNRNTLKLVACVYRSIIWSKGKRQWLKYYKYFNKKNIAIYLMAHVLAVTFNYRQVIC